MAEHDLKLVISADTSDAEKKLKDVGKTKLQPLQIDVTADKVKIDAPKVDPVKIPVETPVVTPKVETPAPVKATVIDPPPVEPKVVQPETIKPTVETPTVTAKVETPVVTPKVETPAPVKATVIEPPPVEPKVIQPETIKPTVETPTVTAKVENPVVKPTVDQPKPVTVEAKAKKVVVEVSDAEAKRKIEALTKDESVKRVRVVTERGELADRKNGKERFEIEFIGNDADVRRKIAELKKDNRLNFVATATGFGAVQQQVLGIRSAISKVVMAFGTIGLVVGIVMSVVEGFKWLKDKIEETSKAVSKLRFDAEMRAAAAETNRLVTAHERLANVLKEELDTLSKQKAVGEIEKNARRDLEDGRREADRARQIYEAKTPEEEQALKDKFAKEDAQIATRRKQEDRRERIGELDQQESAYTAKANAGKEKQKQIDEQIKNEELNVKRARGSRNEGEEMSKEETDARARVESLKKAKEANDLAIATYEKEAKFRRDQIAALEAVKDADGTEAVDYQQKQREKEKARETEKQTTKADADWKDRKKREAEKKDIDEAVESQKVTSNKTAILDAQAASKRDEANGLRQQYEAEMKKDPAERDAEKLAGLRGKIDELEADADAYEKRSKDIKKDENTKRADDLETFADRIDAADVVSQNRLTAMGLGSGVSAKGDVSSDVRKLVDLLRQNVKATENIKIPESSNVSVFAE